MDKEPKKKRSRLVQQNTYIYFAGEWGWDMTYEEIVNGKTYIRGIYYTTPRSKYFDWDPREMANRELGVDLHKHLKKNDFRIERQEKIDGNICYVLEHTDGQEFERVWIAPEQGFRPLKTVLSIS